MKNFINNYITPSVIIIALIVGLGALGYFTITGIKTEFTEPEMPVGSVNIANEYHATSTAEMNGGSAWTAREQRIVATTTPSGTAVSGNARVTPVILGSVIIASSSIDHLTIRNATSSTDIASTTIAVFDNDNNAEGTYVFDIALDRGLVLDFGSAYDGSAIITYR
ncbi:MAG: hypothetical protein U9R01_02035 [candidate division WOR-3 bacterium]|nr:hypothetical protein [candidate division WOR-3 bacterium]